MKKDIIETISNVCGEITKVKQLTRKDNGEVWAYSYGIKNVTADGNGYLKYVDPKYKTMWVQRKVPFPEKDIRDKVEGAQIIVVQSGNYKNLEVIGTSFDAVSEEVEPEQTVQEFEQEMKQGHSPKESSNYENIDKEDKYDGGEVSTESSIWVDKERRGHNRACLAIAPSVLTLSVEIWKTLNIDNNGKFVGTLDDLANTKNWVLAQQTAIAKTLTDIVYGG